MEHKEKTESYLLKNLKLGYITKTQADAHPELIALERKDSLINIAVKISFLYHDIFSYDEEYFNSGAVYIRSGCAFAPATNGIVSTKNFPKKECPCCNKKTLIPYNCIAHSPSGAHIIKFQCENCKEKIAFNNIYDYYKLLLKYLEDYGLWYKSGSRGFSFDSWLSYQKIYANGDEEDHKIHTEKLKIWLKALNKELGIEEKE